MSDPIDKIEAALTPARRKLIYRAGTAVLLIAATHGFVTAEESAAYLQALGLLLGIGVTEMAATHVEEN